MDFRDMSDFGDDAFRATAEAEKQKAEVKVNAGVSAAVGPLTMALALNPSLSASSQYAVALGRSMLARILMRETLNALLMTAEAAALAAGEQPLTEEEAARGLKRNAPGILAEYVKEYVESDHFREVVIRSMEIDPLVSENVADARRAQLYEADDGQRAFMEKWSEGGDGFRRLDEARERVAILIESMRAEQDAADAVVEDSVRED